MPLETEIVERLAASTVRLTGPGTLGSGFFLDPATIATCAHVLFDGDGTSLARTITWAGRSIDIDYTLVSWGAEDDIAIIKSAGLRCDAVFPFSSDLELDDLVFAFGYPEEYPEGDSLTLQYEGPTKSRLPLLKFKAGLVRPGMSGAPLLNMRTRGITGMLTTTRDRRTPSGGRGIPVRSIMALFVDRPTSKPGPVAEADSRSYEQLAAQLQLIRDERVSRTVSGSQRIRVRDLFGEDPVLVPFAARTLAGRVDPLANILRRIEAPYRGVRAIVTGPPGTGKSTFAAALSQTLTNRYLGGDRRAVPVLIDLRDYRDQGPDSEFGSLGWTQARLDEIAGVRGLLRADDQGTPPYPVIILDSLDEYFAGKLPATVADIAGRYLFRRANVACCRVIYYDQHLAMLPMVGGFERFDITPWSAQDISLYVRRYYDRLFPEQASQLADSFIQRIGASSSLLAVCSVPLRLNMALDLSRPGRDELMRAGTMLGLYQAYVTFLLRSEALKGGSVLPEPKKARYLELLAWQFYDEYNFGDAESPPFTHSELDGFLTKPENRDPFFTPEQVADDLREHSLLHEDGSIFSALDPETLSFEHKSFQEFFVARHMFGAVLGDDVSAVVNMFRRPISAEVSEFLKEYLVRARSRARMLTKIVGNLRDAYELNAAIPTGASSAEAGKVRIGKHQVAYYFGVLQVPVVEAILDELYQRENDPLIRRAIAIGLSIGGNELRVHEYVGRLRDERMAGGGPENAVNVGFHLSFFGDQSFDPLRPDVDQGGSDCSHTVRRLVYQLDTETDRGSWRLNLYTIADLWQHRPQFRRSCREALIVDAMSLRRILVRLREDEWSAWWPELDEVAAAVEEAVLDAPER
jgi:trypsin-like peptidase